VNVLVDTPVWSLALRRRSRDLNPKEKSLVATWAELVRDGRIAMIGPVRQEILSGVNQGGRFEKLRMRLAAFPDLPILTADHEQAARFFNACQRRGITGTPIDLLICAVADRLGLSLFTTDKDFQMYARHVPIRLHRA
jgi:predicted nucleic acid-binding protein